MNEDYADVREWEKDYAPSPGRLPGLEVLADGEYDFEIISAELERTVKSGELIFKLELLANSTTKVEKAYFFRSQTGVDMLGADLCTLGLQADEWTMENGKRFFDELPKAQHILKGIRFRGKKQTAAANGKEYHNLYINTRLAGKPMPKSQPASEKAQDEQIPF